MTNSRSGPKRPEARLAWYSQFTAESAPSTATAKSASAGVAPTVRGDSSSRS